jgi:hypothetical protein
MNRWKRGARGVDETLDSLQKRSGFTPLEVLDLAIGGRGDGLGHRMVAKHWIDALALTDLEAGIIKDADAPTPREAITGSAE